MYDWRCKRANFAASESNVKLTRTVATMGNAIKLRESVYVSARVSLIEKNVKSKEKKVIENRKRY